MSRKLFNEITGGAKIGIIMSDAIFMSRTYVDIFERAIDFADLDDVFDGVRTEGSVSGLKIGIDYEDEIHFISVESMRGFFNPTFFEKLNELLLQCGVEDEGFYIIHFVDEDYDGVLYTFISHQMASWLREEGIIGN